MSENLPLFPLQTILFPGGVLPLRIFEVRYLDMVKNCVRDQGEFIICLIREGQESGEAAEHYEVGTACKIIDWEAMSDGLLGITVKGTRRVKIASARLQNDQLAIGEVDYLSEEQDQQLPEKFAEWSELIVKIMQKLGSPFDQLNVEADSAFWVGARLTEYLPFELQIKQRILEINQPLIRLEHLQDSLQKIEYYYSKGNFNT
ncbi:MAG: LON peptidase substrate-binding domain-containing protein [Pseudomonadota bacterium]